MRAQGIPAETPSEKHECSVRRRTARGSPTRAQLDGSPDELLDALPEAEFASFLCLALEPFLFCFASLPFFSFFSFLALPFFLAFPPFACFDFLLSPSSPERSPFRFRPPPSWPSCPGAGSSGCA